MARSDSPVRKKKGARKLKSNKVVQDLYKSMTPDAKKMYRKLLGDGALSIRPMYNLTLGVVAIFAAQMAEQSRETNGQVSEKTWGRFQNATKLASELAKIETAINPGGTPDAIQVEIIRRCDTKDLMDDIRKAVDKGDLRMTLSPESGSTTTTDYVENGED